MITGSNLLSLTSLQALNVAWSPNPPGDVDFTLNVNGWVACALSPNPNQFIAVYPGGAVLSGDLSLRAPAPPYYNLYDIVSSTWGTTSSILNLSNSLINNIAVSYGDGINLMTNIDTDGVQFTTFDGTNFINSGLVGASSAPVASTTYSSYNAPSQTFLVTWLDMGHLPYYTSTNDQGASWVPAVVAQVPWTPPPNFINALQRVFSTASTLNNDFMITWVGTFNMGPSQAFFSIGTPTSLSPGAQVSTSANVGTTVFPSFDPNLNQYIVTWVDSLNATHYPMFTIYDVGTSTWTTPAAIPGASSAVGADGVISSLDPTTNTLIFTWTSLVIGNPPQYVTYNSSMMSPWGTPTPIPGGSATPPQSPIFSTFDPANLLYMFTWWGTDSNLGNYVTASLMQTMTTTTTVTTSPNPSQWNLSRSVDGSCD